MKTFWKIVIGSLVGCLLASLLMFFLGIGFIGSLASFGEKKTAAPTAATILKLDFKTPVTEQADANFYMSGLTSPSFAASTSLKDYISAIDAAAKDPAIKFIYMTPDSPMLGLSQCEEIRSALLRFRDSGKAIVSYCDNMTATSLWLGSVADKLMFNTYGDVFIMGLGTQVIFVKDALDKLGVDVQLIRHGKYKSAGEMFVRNNMSEANREQNQAMVNSLWSVISNDIAVSRGFSAQQFDKWVDNLEFVDAASLLRLGIVDELKYRGEVEDYLCSLFGADKPEDLKFISIEDYAAAKAAKSTSAKNKIAIVYCSGEIVAEEDVEGSMSGIATARTLAELRRDESVKAVVLRVNSPGGSAQAAEMVNHELGLLKAEKPVIASYGEYAASGGYWISARADKIFTDNTTLTGSVGVFSIVPAFGKALKNKVGVNIEAIKSNRHSGMLSMMEPLDAEETAFMQKNVEKVYNDFTELVAEGRSMDVTRVDELGQGRVWTGKDAIEIGFADERGGLYDAILYAEAAAGLTEGKYSVVEYPEVKSAIEKIMESFGGSASALTKILSKVGIDRQPSVYARLPYIYKFE